MGNVSTASRSSGWTPRQPGSSRSAWVRPGLSPANRPLNFRSCGAQEFRDRVRSACLRPVNRASSPRSVLLHASERFNAPLSLAPLALLGAHVGLISSMAWPRRRPLRFAIQGARASALQGGRSEGNAWRPRARNNNHGAKRTCRQARPFLYFLNNQINSETSRLTMIDVVSGK